MASNYTSNYSLCQWQASDKVLRTEFNADNAKIDAAIQAVDRRLTAVAGTKADKSALNTLQTSVSSQGEALALRNCAVYFKSFTGDGKSDLTFTFPARPAVVIFFRNNRSSIIVPRGRAAGYLIGGESQLPDIFSWSGNSITVQYANAQFNIQGQPYSVFAILEL